MLIERMRSSLQRQNGNDRGSWWAVGLRAFILGLVIAFTLPSVASAVEYRTHPVTAVSVGPSFDLDVPAQQARADHCLICHINCGCHHALPWRDVQDIVAAPASEGQFFIVDLRLPSASVDRPMEPPRG